MLRLQRERCRLCGNQSYDLKSIEDNLAARIKILFHLQIKINNDKDKLPKCVCDNCALSVANCWRFYLQIHKIQHELFTQNYVKKEPLTDEDFPSMDEDCPSMDEDRTSTKDNPKEFDTVDQIKESVNVITEGLSDQDDVEVIAIDKNLSGTEDLPSSLTNNKQITNDDVKSTKKVIRTRKRLKIKRKSKGSSNSVKKIYTTARVVTLDKDESWPEYPWWCFTCDKYFDKQVTFNLHPCFQKRHCYYCVDCSKAFMIYNRLIIHVKQYHWDRLRTHILCQCDVCNRAFHSVKEQEAHREQEHPDAEKRLEPVIPEYFSLTCQVCNKISANRGSLKQHLLTHSDELAHVCDTCGQAFRHRAGLKSHVIRYHTTDEYKLHCDQCGKMFGCQGNLNAHMIIHSKERPHTCSICKKSFKQAYYLKLQEAKHSVEKSHVCEICGKGFNCKVNLRSHIKNHILTRNHKCSYCEKTFKKRMHQLNHERQHTGEQPYSCTVCDKKFTCYGNRIKHMKRIHKINPSKKDLKDYMEQD